jgi:predicted nucleic acid-binding protein
MRTFVDTSAFLAILSSDDKNHHQAAQTWIDLVTRETQLICSNYVLVETFALTQRRLGIQAVRTLEEDILPVVNVEWVDEERHKASASALLTAGQRQLSLVDCVSFEIMHKLGINTVFAFDRHFEEQGFGMIP